MAVSDAHSAKGSLAEVGEREPAAARIDERPPSISSVRVVGYSSSDAATSCGGHAE
ncbi:hypothetical protein [Cellulomonas sp. P24]|uniref:hypothetical protein n=1 Tax=Cellulomonas sp. P24 TaxID=2885206 RepID=UPI00216B5716|nr:hypothetical protein [Cellulomonas sp. P24]MCR6493552.1 hypothetical protein [Cellulomonas sp. P24]